MKMNRHAVFEDALTQVVINGKAVNYQLEYEKKHPDDEYILLGHHFDVIVGTPEDSLEIYCNDLLLGTFTSTHFPELYRTIYTCYTVKTRKQKITVDVRLLPASEREEHHAKYSLRHDQEFGLYWVDLVPHPKKRYPDRRSSL